MPGLPALDAEVAPPWPLRLPARNGPDGVLRARGGVVERLLHVDASPVLIRAWQLRDGRVRLRAEALDPGAVERGTGGSEPAARTQLELAISRMRFALGLDDDYADFYARFRSDRLLGPLVRRMPWLRPRRRPWPWEALAWTITAQLIEASRAAEIQRRIVRRWAPRTSPAAVATPASRGPRYLHDVPSAELVAGRAPAELVSMDLTEARSLAMIRCAREVARRRADLSDPAGDRRLLAIREIGPWTVRCLGLYGRGEEDSLPAGDLGFVKLVGRLAGLGRRATVEEVEEFFAPYEPYRGLAGTFALAGLHQTQRFPA